MSKRKRRETEMNDQTTKEPETPWAQYLGSVEERVAGYLMDRVLDEIKQLPDPWMSLPEEGQRAVMDRLRESVRESINNAVQAIAARGWPTWSAKIESVTLKKSAAKVVLHGGANQQVLDIADHTDESAIVIVAAPDVFFGGLYDAKPEPDQRDAFDGA